MAGQVAYGKRMIRDQIVDRVRPLLAQLPVERFRNPPPLVTVLRLSGVIGRLGPVRAGLTLAGLEKAIERAFGPSNVQAVALVVNSPGGSPVQAALIARRIRQFAEEKKVPVVAFAEDVAASGGYWLAAAADEIFADENSIVGSIGVISAGFGFHSVIEKLGVERRVHTAGRRKAMLDPFRAESPEDVARLKSIQSDIHANFKEHLRARRGERLKAPEADVFEGDIWSGRQALAMGVIDGLGDVRTVMRERYGDNVRLRPIPTAPRGLFRRRLALRRPAADAEAVAGRLLAALEEWAHWKRFGL